MALTPEQLAATSLWVDQYTAAFEDVKQELADTFDLAWFDFEDWYDDDLVDQVSADMVDILLADLDYVTGLADQYASTVLAEIQDRPTTILRTPTPQLRKGVDLQGIYRRPLEQYRMRVATGMGTEEARGKALRRAVNMAELDLIGAARDAQQGQIQARGITGYRRIVRPELSESGSCGLCIVASDRIYKTDEVMPIHARCKCTTMPIVGDDDPGNSLNTIDLEAFYQAAGSSKAADLKKTRYAVNEHGELGPLLTYAKDDFKGPRDVKPLEEDPEKARRLLKDAIPVLESLQERHSAGANIQDQLDFQVSLVDRLNRILA